MKLSNIEILPGVIANSNDPKNKGRVKAYVPTLFDTDTEVDVLPWIYPFNMPGYQYYSRMKDGAMIWVINNPDNYYEYWYLPFFKLNSDTQEIADKGEDVDILFDRNTGGNSSRIYYTPDDGIKAENNGFFYQLNSEGEYELKCASDLGIKVGDGLVKVGNSNSEEFSAVKAEKLIKAIQDFCTDLQNASNSLSAASCGASAAGITLKNAATKLNSVIEDIKSENVKILG